MKFDCSNKFNIMLLWASKFAMAKIECSFEISKETHLGVAFILLAVLIQLNPGHGLNYLIIFK